MQLSLTTLAFAFISLVAARDLSVAKKDGKQVTIKSKGTGEVLWFSLSISNGVPLFEIKGSEKDEESGAKANVQLAIEDFNEQGAKKCMRLTGTQGYWSDISVEQVGEDSKKPNQVILRSTMTHQDKDIAGNYFLLALEATIDKDGDAFEIRQQIQNFPYTDGKGILDAGQLFSSSHRGDAKKDASKITLASGGLVVIADSVIEDGTPTTVKAVNMEEVKGAPRSGLCEQSKRTHVEFGAIRPKNATYSEKLVFFPNSIKIVQSKPDTKSEPKDRIKGMTLNGAAPSGAISLGLGASLLAFFESSNKTDLSGKRPKRISSKLANLVSWLFIDDSSGRVVAFMHLLCLLPLLAVVSARNITIVTKTNSTIYAESETKKDTIGYSFAINQNVLSVMLNATESAGNVKPVSYMIIPNLLLEYNKTSNANETDRIFGFQDKNSVIGSWGKGLSATKYKSKAINGTESVDVWQIKAEWSNPEAKNKKPKFNAMMYFASAATDFQGKRLSPNAINVRYSIMNFPFKYKNSTLGLNELLLSSGNMTTNLFSNSTNDKDDEDFGSLRVNRTALVDGKKQRLVIDHYDNSSIDIVAGNSTAVDVADFDKQSVLLSVRNVSGAKNVTIDQRLSLNVTALREVAEKEGANKEEAASPNSSNKSGTSSAFMAFAIAITSVLVALPALIL